MVAHTLITVWSREAYITMALPSHRVTAAHAAPAVTLVGTVQPPASRLTSCHRIYMPHYIK